MISIALFAIIGATIKAGVAYWILFSIYCVCQAVKLAGAIIKAAGEN